MIIGPLWVAVLLKLTWLPVLFSWARLSLSTATPTWLRLRYRRWRPLIQLLPQRLIKPWSVPTIVPHPVSSVATTMWKIITIVVWQLSPVCRPVIETTSNTTMMLSTCWLIQRIVMEKVRSTSMMVRTSLQQHRLKPTRQPILSQRRLTIVQRIREKVVCHTFQTKRMQTTNIKPRQQPMVPYLAVLSMNVCLMSSTIGLPLMLQMSTRNTMWWRRPSCLAIPHTLPDRLSLRILIMVWAHQISRRWNLWNSPILVLITIVVKAIQ